MNAQTRIFRSRLAWTGERFIENPVLIERDGSIVSFGDESLPLAPPGAEEFDFGDAILFPGFINAHCHLEFSCLKGRLPSKTPFAEWITLVGGLRGSLPEQEIVEGIQRGVSECARAGTTTVLDIFTLDTAAVPIGKSGLRAWGFLESISLNPEACESALEELMNRFERFGESSRLKAGLSPHTPYTVSMPLGRRVAEMALERDVLTAIHLAETPEERRMVVDGDGPLVDAFRRIGFLSGSWQAPCMSPVAWADQVGLLGPKTLAVHVNDVTDEEIDLLAAKDCSAVFCPKCHDYFGRPRHPLPKLIEAGVNVCIGTDSLASNSSLDLLAELREARKQFPKISPLTLFKMIGANPAKFLREESRLGVLQEGAHCDLTILSPAPKPTGDPERMLGALLEDGATKAIATIVGGEALAKR